MATVDKAFRIKNGLVVEGSSATVNGSNVLTEASTEFLQDTTAAMFDGPQSGITFDYNDTTGKITATVSTTPTFDDRIIFEGAIPDAYELTLLAPEPVADVTVTLPNATTTLVGKDTTDTFTNKTFNTASTGNTLQINNNTINSYTGSGSVIALATSPSFSTAINLNGASTGQTTLQASATAAGTITFPAVTGTVVTTGDTGSVTNTMLAGSIGNDKLSNSSVTINGSAVSLGGSTTITASNPNALTIGTGLSGTSYDGSSAVTVAIDSTVATTSGTQTLTNKTISGSDNTLSNIGNSSLTNSSITVNANTASLGGSITLDTDDISEAVTSPTNLWFTNERAQDAVATAIANGTQTNITITYDDNANSLSFNASGGVSSISGTANEVEVSASTGAVTIGLPNDITIAGNITINGTPSSDSNAVTKGYVDAIAQGLHIHASCVTATTSNIDLSSDLQAGDVIDGVTLVAGDRVLVKNQSTTSQNGIYTAVTSGVAVRATDFDTSAEIQGGDFVFVTGGTVNDNTGWVQTQKVTTVGTDPIIFLQFSGAGTYLAGNGLTLTGNTFSINTGITADLSTAQTLTNKTISGTSNTLTDIGNGSLTNSSVTINSQSLSLGGSLTLYTDNISEDGSPTNLWFTDARARSAVSAGTGLSYASTSGIFTNEGVTSITGTADQISASASTGSVILSLPQSIATTSSPTFAGLSVGSGSLTAGSITLADALIGTATTSLTTTSATVVDSWSASTFKSAKYIVQMRNGNDIEVLEVLVTVDGNNNVYLTEYADIQSNAQIGTTDADYSGGDVRLLVTSTSGTTVKVHKTLIEA